MTVRPSLLSLLRDATRETHQRLHGHAGFSAIQSGTATTDQYLWMLRRLYGFHRAYEQAALCGVVRTTWLETDLMTLGETPHSLYLLPRCADLPRLETLNQRLGARYVVDGSALGGREMARGLDGLLGAGVPAGRRFFLGHGAATGDVWRQVMALLADAPETDQAQTEIVNAAAATFSAFERWAAGWSDKTDDEPG